MQLKLCIAVISDILELIGAYLPAAESLFNSFGVYGGCYRLAYARYDIPHQRFMITAGPHNFDLLLNFKCRIGGKGRCQSSSLEDIRALPYH